ncbi:hypothetical protein [Sinorhizobium mexicanum]|uniref:hypothetical protein n=1 Tax=Sinorhizobium mexicanum TaxID=375549 RepID=UPI0015DEA10A|nr:hypothetical protein [Sinorhizobium mexicanum]MBP1885827.1 hypothetical protein [Sinorhizobium mexicanum]
MLAPVDHNLDHDDFATVTQDHERERFGQGEMRDAGRAACTFPHRTDRLQYRISGVNLQLLSIWYQNIAGKAAEV